MQTTITIILSIILVLVLSTLINAQPALPGGPSQAPIDGGLGILAAAGGAYALKKLRDRKKEDDIDERV